MTEKFIFREFSTDSLAKTLKNTEASDETIRDAVVNHLKEVVGNNADEEPAVKTSPLFFDEKKLLSIKETSLQEGYEKGYNEAKLHYEQNTANVQTRDTLIEELINELTESLPRKEPVDQYVDLIGEILEEITEKLIIILPSDLTKAIKKLLQKLIDESYKGGLVIIKVNEQQKEFCEEIIKKDQLPGNITDIQVISDSKLADSECIVEYNQTKLVYDKSLVKKEIDEIIRQFKLDS